MFGFDDHQLLTSDPAPLLATARDLGATGVRVAVHWTPPQRSLSPQDSAALNRLITASFGMRVFVAVSGAAASYAPKTAADRQTFCAYARSVLESFPTVNDLVIWNEPNKTYFWKPQFGPNDEDVAPAAYEALLATCYDVLHAYRANVDVLGLATSPDGNDDPHAVSNISHSPPNFIRLVGKAYRASHRKKPLFDSIAHHAYGLTSAERPWRHHPATHRVSQGDLDKLLAALRDAFVGTPQRLPGQCANYRCVWIWYMELAYQTTIPASKAALYTQSENVDPIPADAGGEPASATPSDHSNAPDQATQIVDAVRLAVCQPYVAGFFNYLIRDEPDLRNWQSGVLYVDGSPKPSYAAFRQAISDARGSSVDCNRLKGGPVPIEDTTPPAAPIAVLSGQTDDGIQLSWPGVEGSDIAGYDVLRASGSQPYVQVNDDPIAQSSWTDTSAKTGQTYSYLVRTRDSADLASTLSPTVTVTAGVVPEQWVASFAASATSVGVRLSWRTQSEEGLRGFHVYRVQNRRAIRVDRALIPARGHSSGGGYRVFDTARARDVADVYRLQVVSRSGTTSWVAAARTQVAQRKRR